MENLPQAEEAPDLPAVDENPAAEERPESEPELDLDKLLRSAMQEEADASATPFAASEGTEQPETEPAVVADVPAVEDLLLMPASEEDSRMEQAARTADIPADPAALRELTELTEQAARLDERLQRCESELAEARARVAALEKAAAAPSASLEDLLREGNPLHDRFAALIASSVSQALKAMPSGVTDAVLEERLQSVSLLGKSVSARMDALESRLDTLEPRFNQQVEKAAAGAAARILREEIAKQIQG